MVRTQQPLSRRDKQINKKIGKNATFSWRQGKHVSPQKTLCHQKKATNTKKKRNPQWSDVRLNVLRTQEDHTVIFNIVAYSLHYNALHLVDSSFKCN